MKVSEVMTKKPVCCWPSSSTLSAALLMQETDTGVLPVIQDRFTPTLVGVVPIATFAYMWSLPVEISRPAGLTDV